MTAQNKLARTLMINISMTQALEYNIVNCSNNHVPTSYSLELERSQPSSNNDNTCVVLEKKEQIQSKGE